MTWELIEQPAHESIAAHRLRLAREADFCVRWLRDQGFEVLAISDGPRILIRTSPLCGEFEGVVSGFYNTERGLQRYCFVTRHDCEVRWDAMGDAKREELRQEQAYLSSLPPLKRLLAQVRRAVRGWA